MATPLKTNPTYEFLIELAARDGLPVNKIKEILWLINSQEDLLGFPTVFNNLYHILLLMQAHANVRLADYGIADWPSILRKLLHKIPSWIPDFKKECLTYPITVRKKVKHQMSGIGLRKNALYTICFNKYGDKDPKDDEYALKYALLQGHLILVHIMAMRELVPFDIYESYEGEEIFGENHQLMYEATLALRQLLKKGIDKEKYLDRFTPAQAPSSFRLSLNRIKFMRTRTIDNYFSSYVSYIRQFGKRFSPRRVFGERSTYSGGGGLLEAGYLGLYSGGDLDLEISDTDDPACDWGKLSSIPSYALHKNFSDETKECLQEDVPLSELVPDDELLLSEYECKKTKKGLWHHYLSIRGQMRHRKMANQLFPWSLDVLTANEVATLLQAVDVKKRALWRIKVWSENDRFEAEAIAAITAMFWTGCSIDMVTTAETIPLSHENDSDFAITEVENIVGNDTFWEWRLKTIKPTHYTNTDSSESQTRQLTDHLHLPDLYGSTEILIALAKRSGSNRHGPIFTQNLKDLRKAIKAFLKNVCFGERITISKISYYFFNKILEETGDVATAAAITGKHHHLINVRSFYFTPNVQNLRDIYYTAAKKAGRSIYNRAPRPITDLSFKAFNVGAKKCPNIEDVNRAISEIKYDIQQLSNNWQNDPVSFHNLYTLYTVLMFGNFTGLRAVISPLIPTTEIVNNGSFTILADKEDHFGSKSRPVWVAEVLYQQLLAYEKHCLQIKNFCKLKEQDPLLPCFFLAENKTIELVRPKKVATHLAQYLKVPANAHRRFWRTTLVERQCPAEVVDAWMGHWSAGENPWNVFGTMALVDYFATLKNSLLPFLEKLGWEKIQSPVMEA